MLVKHLSTVFYAALSVCLLLVLFHQESELQRWREAKYGAADLALLETYKVIALVTVVVTCLLAYWLVRHAIPRFVRYWWTH